MLDLDINRIIENLIITFAGGIGGWMITRILKDKRDINLVFNRIRKLEKKDEQPVSKTCKNADGQTVD